MLEGGELTEPQKANIVRRLLEAKTKPEQVKRFLKGVRAKDGEVIYPYFYIPPYNDNKKYQTVIPMSPKTHILSSNSYELEILRLLHLFAPDNEIVRDMIAVTIERLKKTCFGHNYCQIGECFHSALIAMRFAANVANDTEWIEYFISYFKKYMDGKLNKKISGYNNIIKYYALCLTEAPIEIAMPEYLRYKDKMPYVSESGGRLDFCVNFR